MKALILSGGLGSRLRPLTQTGAKQLLPVANKPLIHHVIEDIRATGIRDVVIVVGPETALGIKTFVAEGARWGLNVSYVLQEKPLGLAHAVLISEQALGAEPFVLYLGDNLIQGGIAPYRAEFEAKKPASLLVLNQAKNPQELGVAEFDTQGRLVRVVEKPAHPPSNWAVTGIYFFTPVIFSAARAIKPSKRTELEITDAIQWLLDHGHSVEAARHAGWWKDTGKPEDILEANVLALGDMKGSVDPTAVIDGESQLLGEVTVGPGTTIRRAKIRGPVIIGANVNIEDAFIGPFSAIGDGARVCKSELTASIIMEQAQILDVPVPLDWALIGKGAVVERQARRPAAYSLILGDASRVTLA